MTTVLVISTWKYRDVWPAMAESLRRFWPDCPWRRVLVTDCPDLHAAALEPFRDRYTLGADYGWCENLATAIRSGVYEPPYIMLQEDFLLTREVDTAAVVAAVNTIGAVPDIRQGSVGCFRLIPCPGPADGVERGRVGYVPYGEVALGEPYRVSCQAAVWSRRFLLRCLDCGTARGGSPMHFELAGPRACETDSSRVMAVLRSAPRPPIEYLVTAVVQGRWSRDAVRLVRSWGLDPGARAVE